MFELYVLVGIVFALIVSFGYIIVNVLSCQEPEGCFDVPLCFRGTILGTFAGIVWPATALLLAYLYYAEMQLENLEVDDLEEN